MAKASSRSMAERIGWAWACLLVVAACLAPTDAFAGRVHPNLEKHLAGKPPGERVPVIIELEERANPSAAAAQHRRDKKARGRAVVQALRDVAERTQKPVRAALETERKNGEAGEVRSYWVFNGLAATATERAIRRIAARPDVREVRFDAQIAPPRLTPTVTPAPSPEELTWNIERIRAPEVWALDPAWDGTGIVIGSFDTGVDFTHPDLASRYRGNHATSWFDPYGEYAVPVDTNGHGTHTTGTALGGNASGYYIGVAPGAQWIAARGWNDSGNATVSAFHQIFEWFLAPGGDPDNAPHVVNNSWGMSPPGCYPDFLPDLLAWRAAGIYSAFASGNEGPGSETILSPGNYSEAFAVGASDFDDITADFSGAGPSQCDGEIKPDIAAPGVGVYSALPGDFWFELDGTSMATPHVSGAAAVLLSIDPSLGVDDLESVLSLGAVDIDAPGVDNLSGVGRLDVLGSARIVLGVPLVGIRATAQALEAGTVPGRFTVTRTEPLTDELTLAYTVGGSAIAGSDYVALPGSVTLPAGVASVDIPLVPIDDAVVELDETVVVTLATSTGLLVSPKTATARIVSDELVPDMTLATLSAPSTAGVGYALTASDTTSNTGPGVTPATATRFYLSVDSAWDAGDVELGSRAIPPLASGASSSGSVSLALPAGTATGAYYLIARADSGEATVELSEDNNVATRFLSVGPDLSIADVAAPGGGAGLPMSVTDTTRNQGGGASSATATRFYLSTNATLDAGDVLLGSRSIPALAPGATSTASVSLTIPAGTATGFYYVIAKADGDDALGETNETNNTFAKSITVGANLVLANLTHPSLAGAGLPINVSDTVQNQGGGTAPPTSTRFYLSANPSLDAGDVLLGSRSLAALAPGASDTGSATLVIPAATAAGYYYLIARADGDDALAETSEFDNVLVRVITIGADLVVNTLTVPAMAGAGQPLAVSDTTRNQGGGATPATTTRYYLSANAALEAGDVPLGSRSVAALAPGASDTGSVSLTIPAGTATGSYYVIAKADGDDALAETSETNNTFYRAVIVGPDLAVTALTAPATASAGLAISVGDTTGNASGAATPATVTRFYLSVNATLDAGDVLLGSRAIPALAPGASSVGSVSVTIPAGTASGAYYLIAKADGDDALVEISESNNFASRAITLGSDLIVTALSAPSGGAGLAMTVSDTVRNQGGSAAPATTTRFYLSSDAALDAGDLLLGSRSVAALAAGASNSGSVSLTIPAGTASGAYYLLAKADGDDALIETNEANNVLARSVNIGPDLAVTNLVYPAVAGAGLPINVSDTTQNQGGGAATSTATRFYLSTDAALDVGDVLLGSRSVAALGPGASATGSVSLAIPAGTATGFYYLIAKADGDDALVETNEFNNLLVRVITIGPDLGIGALTAPAMAGAGQSVTVSDTTRNTGGGAAPATTTRFYLSTNGTLDAGDVPLGSRAIATLAPSASDSGSVSLAIPAGTATGSYYLIAKADGDDALLETSETNNTLYRVVFIGPDLIVSALTAPSIAGAGLSITVGDTTSNAGGAGPASNTRFYLSTNGTLDAGDVLLGIRSVPALAAGASSAGSSSLAIPAGTAAGYYYLIAKADGDDALAEISEANNTFYRAITIGPDLTVTALGAPSGGAGLPLSVTDTVRNQGGGAAPATSTRFYLSSNSTLDAGDVLLGIRSVPALAPGASDSGAVSLAIPAGTATGYHYLIAKADGDDALGETSEANNAYARSIGIGPNLVIANVTYPSAAAAGQVVNVGDTAQNQGGGGASATNTRFYLSANTILDASDILLGSRSVAAVAPGASDTGSVSVAIPAGTAPGYYYLITKVDGDDALAEVNELDNTLVRVIQVTP